MYSRMRAFTIAVMKEAAMAATAPIERFEGENCSANAAIMVPARTGEPLMM